MAKPRIKAAAVILKDGRIFTGKHHGDCIKKALENNAPIPITQKQQGFIDEDGNFLTRIEAGEVAFKSGQIKNNPKGNTICSERIWHYGPCDYSDDKGYYFR